MASRRRFYISGCTSERLGALAIDGAVTAHALTCSADLGSSELDLDQRSRIDAYTSEC